jgi:hypothetical protein
LSGVFVWHWPSKPDVSDLKIFGLELGSAIARLQIAPPRGQGPSRKPAQQATKFSCPKPSA